VRTDVTQLNLGPCVITDLHPLFVQHDPLLTRFVTLPPSSICRVVGGRISIDLRPFFFRQLFIVCNVFCFFLFYHPTSIVSIAMGIKSAVDHVMMSAVMKINANE